MMPQDDDKYRDIQFSPSHMATQYIQAKTAIQNEGPPGQFPLHASFLPCVLDRLGKATEKTTGYLFVRKLPTSFLSFQLDEYKGGYEHGGQ